VGRGRAEHDAALGGELHECRAKEAERIAKPEAAKSSEQIEKERKARDARAARQARERKAEEAKRQSVEQKRADRLRPLAGRIIATMAGEDLRELVKALDDWRDIAPLLRLLSESMATAVRDGAQ
jgi:hypothetical protein